MMILTYLFFMLAGSLMANGVPHFIKGITGERHMTPFAKPSGPMVNVIWGVTNFVTSYVLFSIAAASDHSGPPAAAAVFTGILLTGILLAAFWEDDYRAKGHDHSDLKK